MGGWSNFLILAFFRKKIVFRGGLIFYFKEKVKQKKSTLYTITYLKITRV
jgi:hypothetical protein